MSYIRDWGKFRKLCRYMNDCRSKPTLQGAIEYSGYGRARAAALIKEYYPAEWRRMAEVNLMLGAKKARGRRLARFLRTAKPFTLEEAAAESGYSIRSVRAAIRRIDPDALARVQKKDRGDGRFEKLAAFVEGTAKPFTLEEAAAESGYSTLSVRAAIRRIDPDALTRVRKKGRDGDGRFEKLSAYVKENPGRIFVKAAARAAGCSREWARATLRRFWAGELERSRVNYETNQRQRQARLFAYVDANPTFSLEAAAIESGLSERYCAKILKINRPEAWKKNAIRKNAASKKLARLLAYADSTPELILADAAAESGYSIGNAARFLRRYRPELWENRPRVFGLEEYKGAGGPPHFLAAAAKLCPDGKGKTRLLAACKSDPYFNSPDSAFLSRYIGRKKTLRRWDGDAYETCRRALENRDALLAANVFEDGAESAAAVAGVPIDEAATIAFSLSKSGGVDEELERLCVDPPQEYLDDVNARDFPGARLPPSFWERYYAIYHEKRAGKFTRGARPSLALFKLS